jgi:hypothetical protein
MSISCLRIVYKKGANLGWMQTVFLNSSLAGQLFELLTKKFSIIFWTLIYFLTGHNSYVVKFPKAILFMLLNSGKAMLKFLTFFNNAQLAYLSVFNKQCLIFLRLIDIDTAGAM